MKKVKRIRISQEQEDFYRAYFSDISFQKFFELCVDNEIRRKQKKRLRCPF